MGEEVPSAIRGWGCTPTGELPAAAVPTRVPETSHSMFFLRGWRRTALYLILIFLIILVCLNIGLTLWIISTLKLNARGIGAIKIVQGGIKLDGQAWVMDKLVASTISSLPAQPMIMHAYRNFSVVVSEPNQVEESKLVINRNGIECSGKTFTIRDSRGGVLFSAARDEVHVQASTLSVRGAGAASGAGMVVTGAVLVPTVVAPYGKDLLLESGTRGLEIRAPRGLLLESRAGDVTARAHNQLALHSMVGAIKIDAPNIMMPNLKIATVATPKGTNTTSHSRVFQLCACGSGRLFLAAPDAFCHQQEKDQDLCR